MVRSGHALPRRPGGPSWQRWRWVDSVSSTDGAHPRNPLRATGPRWQLVHPPAQQSGGPAASPARTGPHWGCPSCPPRVRRSNGGGPGSGVRLPEKHLGDRWYRRWHTRNRAGGIDEEYRSMAMRPQEPVAGPGWVLKPVALWLLLTNRVSHTPFGTLSGGLPLVGASLDNADARRLRATVVRLGTWNEH